MNKFITLCFIYNFLYKEDKKRKSCKNFSFICVFLVLKRKRKTTLNKFTRAYSGASFTFYSQTIKTFKKENKIKNVVLLHFKIYCLLSKVQNNLSRK